MNFAYVSAGLLVAFAFFLQVQITLFPSDDYIGLRVNMADLLLPFAGLLIAGSLLLKKSQWPFWQTPFGYWAPVLLSIIVGLSLLNGYWVQGSWSHWALLNKGVGWAVLMAYLLAGAWFSTNKPDMNLRYFLVPFIAFLLITAAGEILLLMLYHTGIIPSLYVFGNKLSWTIDGLMANRNAFAFLYLCALLLGSAQLIRNNTLSSSQRYLFKSQWFLLPLFFLLNLSRASLLIFVPFILYLLFAHRRIFLRDIMPFLIAGTLLTPMVDFDKVERVSNNYQSLSRAITHVQSSESGDRHSLKETLYSGDKLRIQIIQDCWEFIKQYPLTGAGIGTALKLQHDEDRHYVSVIDNTALWILTEMGPFGLLGFAGVYVCMLIALNRRHQDAEPEEQAFIMGAVFMLLAFGVYSLLHEIIYTRFFWFILGLSLAVPATAHPAR